MSFRLFRVPDQPAFNRNRLKAEKLIGSKVLEQFIRVQMVAGCSSQIQLIPELDYPDVSANRRSDENIGEFFAPLSWPGLTRPSSHDLKNLVFFWMAASKGGHNDGIGGNIRVIKFQKEKRAATQTRLRRRLQRINLFRGLL
jgi:hypothetical protein